MLTAQKLMKWRASEDADFILGAGSKGSGNDKEDMSGVFCSHAYAVLDIIACPVRVCASICMQMAASKAMATASCNRLGQATAPLCLAAGLLHGEAG